MSRLDLNLLFTLDALLSEGSVARAAKRLRLSPSAMSRALARVRAETGDPLLVRAGRGLVPTPRAIELREQVARIAQEAEAALRPQDKLDVRKLERTFSLRTSDGFVETFGLALVARAGREAPGVKLRFVQKPQRDSAPLREGNVDLETGVVVQALGPELRSQALFRDRFVGVVRRDHPLGRGDVARDDYLSGKHVLVSRRGLDKGPIDDALEALGFTRNVVVIVGGFSAALELARASDLIASVPERHTAGLRAGLRSFPLPVAMPEMTISMLWHPRLDADPAHRWLRGLVREICAAPRADGAAR